MIPEWLNLLACGITVASAGPTVHSSISSFRRAKKIEAIGSDTLFRLEQLDGKFAELDGKLSKVSDHIFMSKHIGVQLPGMRNLDKLPPIENLAGISSGVDLVVDMPTSPSGDLISRFEASPDLFLVGIQPLLNDAVDVSLLQDPTMVPWHFRKWDVEYIGFAKRGFIESLGIKYNPIPVRPLRGPEPSGKRTPELKRSYWAQPYEDQSTKRLNTENGALGEKNNGVSSIVQGALFDTLKKGGKPQKRFDQKPLITVFGVGGAGGNAVDAMIGNGLNCVDFVVANTDAAALAKSSAKNRIQLGAKIVQGLGAGARASVGAAAAEESIEQIVDHLAGKHICFIAAGLGGGTGTGAAPIVAQAAKELGLLTVAVVSTPFQFEGSKRLRQAEDGIEALRKVADALVVISNQNLFRLADSKTTFTEAFAQADDVLYQAIQGFSAAMSSQGLINFDFSDVREIVQSGKYAHVGTGSASGDHAAQKAVKEALSSPVLGPVSSSATQSVLLNVMGSDTLTVADLEEAVACLYDDLGHSIEVKLASTQLDHDSKGVRAWLFIVTD